MRRAIRMLVGTCLLGAAVFACADIVVVAHPGSGLRELSAAQVSDLYLGRTRSLPDGRPVIVLERERDGPMREKFFRLLNGMSLKEINAYWARLQFSGQVLPPAQLADAQLLLRRIQSTPVAIGYVDAAEVDDSVRVVLRLRERL